ncbi:MAG: GxxExxY protein [Patescibacteria group bacterium]
MNTNNKKIIHPELSYTLMGILFDVQTQLGSKYLEKHYQRAVETKLKEVGIPYKREASVDLKFGNEFLGKFILDFIIDNKIVLELKKTPKLDNDDIKQALRYLEATDLDLAIVANFNGRRLSYKRVIRATS